MQPDRVSRDNWIISVSIPSPFNSSRTRLRRMAVFPSFRALPLKATTFIISCSFLPTQNSNHPCRLIFMPHGEHFHSIREVMQGLSYPSTDQDCMADCSHFLLFRSIFIHPKGEARIGV